MRIEKITITKADLRGALEQWERDSRVEGTMRTDKERRKMSPAQVGSDSAKYLFRVLVERGARL